MPAAHATFVNPADHSSINIVINGVPTVLSRGDCIRFRRTVVAGHDPITTAKIIDFGWSGGYVNRIFYLPWRVAEQRWGSGQLPMREIGLEPQYIGTMSGEDWTTITKLANCPASIAAAPMVGVLDATFLPKAGKERPETRLRIGANEIRSENALEATEFVDGEEVIVLERATYGFKHVFKRAALEMWFTTHPPASSPITRKILTQADIERYTLHIIHEGGAKKRRSRRRRTMKKYRNKALK